MHLILGAHNFQTSFSKQTDVERRAKHAKAGVEISNHECITKKHHIFVMHPTHFSCAVKKIHSRLLENV